MTPRNRLGRLLPAVTAALLAALAGAPAALAAKQPPAAGADIGQVVIATLGATIATAVMLWVCVSHRSGRIKWLGKLAALAERETGVSGWSSLPAGMLGVSPLIAVFGMYWDISLHIDNGRDPGPLANPAHYFILVGLFGVLFSGVLAVALTEDKPSSSAIRLPNGWWAPLGAIVVMTCGAVSLIAFPLDDVWHRIFGQDVTLWGPTHLLLIGGAAFSILGQWILDIEGHRAATKPAREGAFFAKLRNVGLVGSLLIGLSTFQAEFDFSVPQFRLVWHPLLLALAAGMGLVAARVRLGRGGALLAALFFIGLRGILSLVVGPVFGQTTPHFPLYIVEALLVEAVALRYYAKRSPITLGAISGVLIGTVGFFAEYAWSNVVHTIGWTPSLIPEGLICATVAGVAGGVLGGAIGRSVTEGEPEERMPRWLVPVAGLAVIGLVAWAAPSPNGDPVKAQLALTPAGQTPSGDKEVFVTAKLDPPDAASDPRWFVVTAWQGGASVVGDMKKVGPGEYRSEKPIPVGGDDWKSTLRLQRGSAVLGLPIYMPEDSAIPVKAIPEPAAGSTREFVRDKSLLQREQKKGVAGWLTLAAYVGVFLIFLTMIGVVSWGLARLGRSIGALPPGKGKRAPRSSSPARTTGSPTAA